MYFILDRNESWSVIEIEIFVAERGMGILIMEQKHYSQNNNRARSRCTLRAAGSVFSPSITGKNNVLEQENELNLSGRSRLSFSGCFTEKQIFSTEKQDISLREGHRPHLSLCLEILDSEIPPEHEVSLFQFQLWLRKSKFLIACKTKQTENSSDVFHVPYSFF